MFASIPDLCHFCIRVIFSTLLCKILYQSKIIGAVSEKKIGTYISTKGPREMPWVEMKFQCGHHAPIPASRELVSIAESQSTLMICV